MSLRLRLRKRGNPHQQNGHGEENQTTKTSVHAQPRDDVGLLNRSSSHQMVHGISPISESLRHNMKRQGDGTAISAQAVDAAPFGHSSGSTCLPQKPHRAKV